MLNIYTCSIFMATTHHCTPIMHVPLYSAAEERKRKSAKKVDEDTTLYPNPKVKVIEKDPLWDTT